MWRKEIKTMNWKKVMASITVGISSIWLYGAEVNAEELTADIELGQEQTDTDLSVLSDGEHTTDIVFQANDKINITSQGDDKIAGLYIIWDSPISDWTLTADSTEIKCGQYGFIHEYIPIEGGASKLTINIPADDVAISDIRIFSEGQLPSDVQVWDPPCEKADIMLISSHSDDELLFFGGVIPIYSYIYDTEIQVVYLTEFWSKEKVREHEKLDGLWTAGVDNYPVCGDFYDEYVLSLKAAKDFFGVEPVTEYITSVVRRFKPQIVVTHDFKGEYGHGLHLLVAECTADVVENSMNEDYYPESAKEYGTWDVPKTYIHIYKENTLRLDLSVAIEERDGKTALQLIKDAYYMHESQHKYWFYVSDSYEYSCADFGLYRTTVGLDTGNDMLEHIKTYKVQAEEERQRLEQESLEQASIEQESLEQASREQASIEQASLEQASREQEQELVELEKKNTQQTVLIVVVTVAILAVIGGIVCYYKSKKK